MKRTPLITLASLLLLLVFVPGCDNQAPATPAEDDTQTPSEAGADHPADPPVSQTPIAPTGTAQPNASARLAPAAEEVPAASAYVVIQNAGSTDPQLLVRQLQQVLPKTQVVKQMQSPNPREIKLEVTNIKDVRALANKIPFGSVESIDDRTRTITVDFDL